MNQKAMIRKQRRPQQGVFLLEALIAILIFSIGILGMVAMGGVAIAAQSDAQYRTDAANFANELASEMTLAMGVISSANDATMDNFAHQPINGGVPCSFAGSAAISPVALAWIDKVTGVADPRRGLPGADPTSIQVQVNTGVGAFRRVQITICWKPPATAGLTGSPWNQYQLVTYINPNDA